MYPTHLGQWAHPVFAPAGPTNSTQYGHHAAAMLYCYHSAVDFSKVEDVVLSLQKDVVQGGQVVETLPQLIQHAGYRVVVVDSSPPNYHNVATHLRNTVN